LSAYISKKSLEKFVYTFKRFGKRLAAPTTLLLIGRKCSFTSRKLPLFPLPAVANVDLLNFSLLVKFKLISVPMYLGKFSISKT
jgi:hypothetical protein